jgi:hypothetical protein
MNENKFDQQYKATLSLISELRSISIYRSDLENPLLNLGKPTHENLVRVDKFLNRKSKNGIFSNIFTYLPYLSMSVMKNFIHHLKYFPHLKILNESRQNSEYFFVSHFVGQKITSEGKDSFFGDMPTFIREKNLGATTVYVNHKKNSKNFSANYTKNIVPKTCFTRDRLLFIFWAVGRSLNYFVLALRTSFTNSNKANKIFLLARLQTDIASFNNQILLSNLMKLIRKTEPKRIVFTLEGHPYELFLARNLKFHTIDTKMIFWQLAPVVRSQNGFLETIENLPGNCEVLVTGESIKKYIIENITSERKISVIGSPKFQVVAPSDNSKSSILLAPEGSKEAVEEFITLIPILCKSFPNRKVILRLHPAVNETFTIAFFSRFSGIKNFEYSTGSLLDDLEKSEYCVYRSSSVSIEALNYGVKPIHFSKFADGELNPLALNNSWLFEAQNPSHLVEIISRNPIVDKELLQVIYKNFYSKLCLEKFLLL